MKTIINAHKATPEEAIQFTQYLLQKFPIITKKQITIEFRPTNSIGRGNWGRTHNYQFNNTIFLELALGFSKERRPLSGLLHTIAHEYCHALQYDQDRIACCKEADKFGDMEAGDFLKKQEKAQLA